MPFVQGLSIRPSDRLTINFLFRDYSVVSSVFMAKDPEAKHRQAMRGAHSGISLLKQPNIFLSAAAVIFSIFYGSDTVTAALHGE